MDVRGVARQQHPADAVALGLPGARRRSGTASAASARRSRYPPRSASAARIPRVSVGPCGPRPPRRRAPRRGRPRPREARRRTGAGSFGFARRPRSIVSGDPRSAPSRRAASRPGWVRRGNRRRAACAPCFARRRSRRGSASAAASPSASSTVTPSSSWLSPTTSQPRRISTPSAMACSASSRSVIGLRDAEHVGVRGVQPVRATPW